MNNKLKSFRVIRQITMFEQITIKARNETDVWKRMDKYQLENGKEYNWKRVFPDSRVADITYTIANN